MYFGCIYSPGLWTPPILPPATHIPNLMSSQPTEPSSCYRHVHKCRVIHWNVGNIWRKLTPPAAINCQCGEFVTPSSMHTGMLTGLMLAHNHSSEFLGMMALSCPEDTIHSSLPSFWFLPVCFCVPWALRETKMSLLGLASGQLWVSVLSTAT